MIIFFSIVLGFIQEIKTYIFKSIHTDDKGRTDQENERQLERKRRIQTDLGLGENSLANMWDVNDDDYEDDDMWDFGDGRPKSPPEPRMQVKSKVGHKLPPKASWAKESFKTNTQLTAPPVRPKMLGRGAARACNVGGFNPRQNNQTTSQGESDPNHQKPAMEQQTNGRNYPSRNQHSNPKSETQNRDFSLNYQLPQKEMVQPQSGITQQRIPSPLQMQNNHITEKQSNTPPQVGLSFFTNQQTRQNTSIPFQGIGRGRGNFSQNNQMEPNILPGVGNSKPSTPEVTSSFSGPWLGRGRGRGRGRGISVSYSANPQVEVISSVSSQYNNLNISSPNQNSSHSNNQSSAHSPYQHLEESASSSEFHQSTTTDSDSITFGEFHNTPSDSAVSESWIRKVLSAESEITIPVGSEQVDAMWLDRIQTQWCASDRPSSAAICGLLHECLRSVVNPYTTALYLIEKAKDFYTAKTTTLAFSLTKELDRWAKDDKELHHKCLNRDIKTQAFHVGCRASFTYFDNIAKIFRFNHEGNEYFLVLIQPYIAKKKFKEAAHCATKLGLQSHFDIKEICLPLILQDKVNMVENYVFRNHQQQTALLQLLDFLVSPETDLAQLIHESDVPKIKRDKITKKIISKLAVRLMKLYQVPQEMCPNICQERTLKGLRYLMYKKYIEGGLGHAQWLDLVKSTVGDNTALQDQLIEQLISYLDMEEAAKWAKHFNIPAENIPHQITDLVHTANSIDQFEEETWEDAESCNGETTGRQYHTLSLPADALHWVDSRDTFYNCLDHITLPGTTVGIDGEWKPSFGQNVVSKMALLQLATRSGVFLLDMMALSDVLEVKDWTHFTISFFGSTDVLKLGYSIESDLQMLVRTIPCLGESLNQTKRLVDLQTLHSAVCRACPDVFDSPSEQSLGVNVDSLGGASDSPGGATDDFSVVKSEERGLAELVSLCLGRPLDKKQQLSDWERRPLRQQQINYAALDAFCLIEVYDFLLKKILELSLKVNPEPCIGYKSKPRKTRAEKKQQRVAERPEKVAGRVRMPPNPPRQTGVTVDPNDFRVVCDNMLQGLGRYLRCCGVDVRILENSDDHTKAAVYARNEDRIILTSGAPFVMLRNQVPVGYCYNVGPGKARDQVSEVLGHFNVHVTAGDIFSRCQVCNGNDYLRIDGPEMITAWVEKMTRLGQGHKVTTSLLDQSASEKSLHKEPRHQSTAPDKKCSIEDFLACETDSEDDDIEFDNINMDSLTVGSNNVPLQVEVIPEGLLHKIRVFYVCATCGKVFWEGGHFTKVREQFAHVMKNDDNCSYLERFLQGKSKLKQ